MESTRPETVGTAPPGAPLPGVPQLEAMAKDFAAVRQSGEQLAAGQEQLAQDMVKLRNAVQEIQQKTFAAFALKLVFYRGVWPGRLVEALAFVIVTVSSEQTGASPSVSRFSTNIKTRGDFADRKHATRPQSRVASVQTIVLSYSSDHGRRA
jgi:hypothetical protein